MSHANHSQACDIRIERWKSTRFWAIFVNGELLTVTVYKKGALVLRDRILQGTL